MRQYGGVPDVTDLRPGDPEEVAGYRVVGRLGAGGQGVVYLGVASSGLRVAIKVLRSVEDETARRQLGKEVAAARRVAPFCTAQVVDARLEGPTPYVISEFIEGPSLQQQVQREGVISGVTLQRLAVGTATALAAIHQAGVVHRDFKPANVMLSPDGPRVIDFGIARDLSTDTTVTSRVFGTPAYMSPEQLRAEPVGPPTDMFAWASVMAYAATGRVPFDAPHVMAVVHRIGSGEPDLSGVPAELAEVLRRCLEKDPARRPTAQQALAQLFGRPAPAHDLTDPTRVLAEATSFVQPTAPTTPLRQGPPPVAPVDPARPSRPTEVIRPAPVVPSPVAGFEPAPTAWGAAPTPAGGRRGPLIGLLVAALVLVVVGVLARHAINRSDQPSGTASGSTASPTAGSAGTGNSSDDTDDDIDDATDDEGAGSGGATSDDVTPPTSPADSDPAADGTVPAAFDGTWQGRGVQPGGVETHWEAEVKLDAGRTTGTMKILDLDCSSTLTLEQVGAQWIIFGQRIERNPDGACAAAGRLQLTLTSAKRLRFVWQDDADAANQATGELRRR